MPKYGVNYEPQRLHIISSSIIVLIQFWTRNLQILKKIIYQCATVPPFKMNSFFFHFLFRFLVQIAFGNSNLTPYFVEWLQVWTVVVVNFNVDMNKSKPIKPVFCRAMAVGFEISFIESGRQYLEQFLGQTLPSSHQKNIIVSQNVQPDLNYY